MSSITPRDQTRNQISFDVDTSKVFVFGNEYISVDFLNNTGGVYSPLEGTVVGRVTATGKVVPCQKGVSDGSQVPFGILKGSPGELADADELKMNVCVKGEVVEAKVIVYDEADDLDTDWNGRQLRDRINGDTVGILLVGSDELSKFNN